MQEKAGCRRLGDVGGCLPLGGWEFVDSDKHLSCEMQHPLKKIRIALLGGGKGRLFPKGRETRHSKAGKGSDSPTI